jgi:hypothetical protein
MLASGMSRPGGIQDEDGYENKCELVQVLVLVLVLVMAPFLVGVQVLVRGPVRVRIMAMVRRDLT